MIQDQIAAIQSKLAQSPNIPEATRAELAQLLAELQTEVASLSTESIPARNVEEDSVEDAFGELRRSIEGFETSHPKVTNIVGQIATTLSNMGI